MGKDLTTLFENVMNRARYLGSIRFHSDDPPAEDESANDLAWAICEEMERLTVRIEKMESKLNGRQHTGPTNPYDCSRRKGHGR